MAKIKRQRIAAHKRLKALYDAAVAIKAKGETPTFARIDRESPEVFPPTRVERKTGETHERTDSDASSRNFLYTLQAEYGDSDSKIRDLWKKLARNSGVGVTLSDEEKLAALSDTTDSDDFDVEALD